MKSTFLGLLAAALLAGPITANATLMSVDNGLGVYDSVNKGTWTSDGNLFRTQLEATGSTLNLPSFANTIIADAAGLSSLSGHTLNAGEFSADGRMTWYAAVAWVNYLNVTDYGGSNQWMLPTTVDALSSVGFPDGSAGDPSKSSSQMATLFYGELGVVAGAGVQQTTGYGLFSDFQRDAYWSATPYTLSTGTLNPPAAFWFFDTANGQQAGSAWDGSGFVMAVSHGKLHPVPEPATLSLLALGLAGVGFMRRRHAA